MVTGATGGVGSAAVSMLAARGYRVIAVSGRPEHAEYVRSLGAAEVIRPAALDLGSRPLEAARFGGVIDNVGGDLLAGLIRHVGLWGQVACIGMAAGSELATSVFPLILRGVSLLGVSSANCPMSLRQTLWNRLAVDWRPDRVHDQVRTIDFEDLPTHFDAYLKGMVRGRTVVRIGRDSHP